MKNIFKLLIIPLLSFNILNVSAQNVQIDEFGYQNEAILFKLKGEYNKGTQIDWDFGDNNKETGNEVIHRYDKLGEYDIKTKIQNSYIKEEYSQKINIVESSALLLNNIEDKQFEALNNFAKLNDFYIKSISTGEQNSSIKSLEIKSEIENIKIEKFNYFIVWSNNPSEIDFIYTLDERKKELLKNKNLIFITSNPDDIYLQRKINNLNFKNSIIAGKEVIYDLIEIKKFDSFLNYITNREYKFTNLDKDLIFKKPYLVLTLLSDSLLDSGLNPDILYMILLIPILYGFMSVTNNIIGIRFLNKYSFITFVIGSMIASVEIMLIYFLLAVTLGIVNKITIDKLNVLKIPKENLNIGLFVTIGMITIFGLNQFELILNNQLNNYLASLVIASFGINQIYSNISQRKTLKNIKIIFANLLSWTLIAIYFGGNTMLINNNIVIKQKILSNPEIIILFLAINLLAMIYSGLRVTEYINYKKIYENLEE